MSIEFSNFHCKNIKNYPKIGKFELVKYGVLAKSERHDWIRLEKPRRMHYLAECTSRELQGSHSDPFRDNFIFCSSRVDFSTDSSQRFLVTKRLGNEPFQMKITANDSELTHASFFKKSCSDENAKIIVFSHFSFLPKSSFHDFLKVCFL